MKTNRVLRHLVWVAALAAGHAFAAGPPGGVPGFPAIASGTRLIDVGVPSRVPFTAAPMAVPGAPTPVFVSPNAVQTPNIPVMPAAPTVPTMPAAPAMPAPTAMLPAVPGAPGVSTSVGPEMPAVPEGVVPQNPAIAETRYHSRLIPACQ